MALASQDARLDQRHVLPLRALAPLRSDELGGWRRKYAPGVNEFTGWHAVRFEDPDVAASALDQLLKLQRRRLMGVYHVLDFRQPRWVHKINRLHPEWLRGTLLAWLVVYDLRSDDALCQVQITVHNDVRNASVRIRLRSDTRNELVTQLGTKLREETTAALRQITSVLRVPPA